MKNKKIFQILEKEDKKEFESNQNSGKINQNSFGKLFLNSDKKNSKFKRLQQKRKTTYQYT